MEMKIKYGDNEVIITSINPTEERLEITVSKETSNFETLQKLEGYQGNIEYYEDGELIIAYSGYNANFNCIYIGSTYTVILKRIGAVEQAIIDLQEKIETTWSAVDFILTEGL